MPKKINSKFAKTQPLSITRVNPTLVSNYNYVVKSGEYIGVSIFGVYVYLMDQQYGLQIIDVSNPASPTFKGSYKNNYYNLVRIVTSGNFAYVIDNGNNFFIVNVGNPFTPSLSGNYNSQSFNQVSVSGALAYVSGYYANKPVLYIFNTVNLTTALQPLSYYPLPNFAGDIVVSEQFVYVVSFVFGSSNGLLQIIDISNPIAPSSKGNITIPNGSPTGIAKSGNYLYVTNYITNKYYNTTAGLEIIDVSNPMLPILKGSFKNSILQGLGVYPTDVAVAGNYAYLAVYNYGLVVVNVSNPMHPSLKSSNTGVSQAWNIDISGNTVGIGTAYGTGLAFYDVSNPAAPIEKSLFNPNSYPYSFLYFGQDDFTISGNYTYTSSWTWSESYPLVIVDISNPSSPSIKQTYNIPPGSYRLWLAVSGNFVYVTNDNAFLILDVSNPSTPKPKSCYGLVNMLDVTLSGSMAYIANGDYGLGIMNVSDPANPILKSCYITGGHITNIAISGNVAFAAAGNSGLQLIDITNPTNPKLISQIGTKGYAQSVAVSGGKAYVAQSGPGYLQIFDVTNSGAPVVNSNYTLPAPAHRIVVLGNTAYIADDIAGLRIIDVTDPINPTLKGLYYTPNSAVDVVISGELAYVVDSTSGLYILDNVIPNQPPILVNNQLVIHKGQTKVFTTSELYAMDPDTSALSLVFTPTNILSGYFELSGAVVSTFSQAEVINSQISFVHDGSDSAPSYSIQVNDGYGPIPVIPSNANITFITVPPIIVRDQFDLVEGQSVMISTKNIEATTLGMVDPDLIFTLNNITYGHFEKTSNPGVAIPSFLQQDVLNRNCSPLLIGR